METEQPNIMELSDLSTESEGTPREQLGSLNLLGLSEHGMYQLHLKDEESDYSSSVCSSKSEKSVDSQGLSFGYQVFESSENGTSPTQSPPLQTMDRVGGFESYDPSRIPSAVFQRNLSFTPLEWSVASNESLFSIHMGNTSFSRDQVLMMGADLGKSESTKTDKLFVFNPPPPGVITKGVEFEEKPEKGDTTEYNIKVHEEDLVSENASVRSVLPPARLCSDGSQRSSDSFAFPIKKKGACLSCYCFNCLPSHCYPAWSSCCWNGSRARAFSNCWNCSRKGFFVTPLTFWRTRRHRMDLYLWMVKRSIKMLKALQSHRNQQQILGFLAVRVLLVATGVAVHVHILLVANGVAVCFLLVANGVPVRFLLVANGIGVLFLLVANGIGVWCLLVANGIVVHFLLVANGIVVHVLPVTHGAAVAVVFVNVVAYVVAVIFVTIVIIILVVVVAKNTVSQRKSLSQILDCSYTSLCRCLETELSHKCKRFLLQEEF